MNRNRRDMQRLLQATGLPWSLENGKRHLRIFLAGREVGVITDSNKAQHGLRGTANLQANIRKAVREHGQKV